MGGRWVWVVGVGWWYGDHECLDLDTPFVHPEPAYLTGGIYLHRFFNRGRFQDSSGNRVGLKFHPGF